MRSATGRPMIRSLRRTRSGLKRLAGQGCTPWRSKLQAESLEERRLLSVSPSSLNDPRLAFSAELAEKMQSSPFMANELVVAIRQDWQDDAMGPLTALSSRVDDPLMKINGAELVLRTEDSDGTPVTLYRVGLGEGVDLNAALAKYNTLTNVAWAAPNFIYDRDPREFIPDDGDYSGQYHHPLMHNDDAWDITQGAGVIIAVTDDGVDIDHEDLAANIWTNPGELAGNGLDDDSNGFVDDVHGWDFSSNDGNVRPENGDSHGTHVAGIAAGVTNNGIGAAGTAGQATIMPIRFYGSGAWTSTVIAKSYTYATDNGAKIVSTSYSVDGFINDPIFLAGVQYMYDHGVLHLNSAGNDNALNPARAKLGQSVWVANTNSADIRNGSSSYGVGIDISAPGTSIYATIPNNSYGYKTGTSMSTPNTAGVAALIWSLHPTWTRDQVAAQLMGTADNIDALNPLYVGYLGTGRVNSYRALTETIAPPRIDLVRELPTDNLTVSTAPSKLTVHLASVFDPATINNLANWELRSDGADNTFDTADDKLISLALVGPAYVATNEIVFNLGSMGQERYRFKGSTSLKDPFGTAIDGNGDHVAGDAFSRTFTFAEPPVSFTRVEPLGSMVSNYHDTAFTFGGAHTPTYTVHLVANQLVTMLLDPQGASPLVGAGVYLGASQVATLAAGGGGANALLQNWVVPTTGDYTIKVTSNIAAGFDLDIDLNASRELESIGMGGNDGIGSAQELTASGVPAGSGNRMAVLGSADGGEFYQVNQTKTNVVFSPNVLTYTFTGTGGLPPVGAGTLTLIAVADLDASNEFLTLTAEGINLGNQFVTGGLQQSQVTTTVNLTQAQLTTLAADGTITFTVTPSAGVNNLGSNSLTLALDYPLISNRDYYHVGLTAGQLVSVNVEGLSPGTLTLDVVNSANVVVATSSAGLTNVTQAIQNFTVPTTGEYYVRVGGNMGTKYSLVSTWGMDFSLEPNDVAANAKPLGASRQVLGYIAAEPGQLLGDVAFTLDSTVSTVTVSGDIGGVPIIAQTAGSNVGRFGGTIAANLGASSITFIGGSAIDAVPLSGNYLPSNLPADMAIRVALSPPLYLNAALRNILLDMTSTALTISGTSFAGSALQFGFNNGSLDYELPGVFTGTQSLIGIYAGNEQAGTATLETLTDRLKLTIPVNATGSFVEPTTDLAVNYVLTGQLVAYVSRPVPQDTEDDYTITLTAGQQYFIQTTTPTDTAGMLPGNGLDPRVTLIGTTGVQVATNDDSAPDGKNARIVYTAPTTGTYRIRVIGESGNGEYTLSVVQNQAPTANAGGPYAINEGSSLLLNASLSSDPDAGDVLTYTWDVNGDGTYGDATGVSPTLTWSQLQALGINDGPVTKTVRVRVDDGHGHVVTSGATNLTVSNAPPSASAGSAYQINEGASLQLTASATDPAGASDPLTYSWDINGDGTFGDAVGQAPLLTWAQLLALGLADGPGTYQVSVRVSDGDGGSTDSSAVTLTVLNVLPTVSVSGPTSALRGERKTFTFTAHDATASSMAGLFVYNINWGDGSPLTVFEGNSELQLNHGFNATGLITVSVTVTDKDGGISSAVTHNLTVDAMQLRANTTTPALMDLVWGGTDGIDEMSFQQLGGTIRVHEQKVYGAAVNNTVDFTVAQITGRVIAYGFNDNDELRANGLQSMKATLDGGGGSNTLFGGNGGDLLIGGSNGGEGKQGSNVIIAGNGENTIYGNDINARKKSSGGNNLIVGGTGNDTIYGSFGPNPTGDGGEGGRNMIVGGGGSDTIYTSQITDGAEGGHGSIVIAGKTSFEQPGRESIFSEWTSARTFAQRLANIQGTGTGPRSNGSDFLIAGSTVTNDNAADVLFSDTNGAENWLFYNFVQDTANRVKPTDIKANA